MSTSFVSVSISGGSHLKTNDCTFFKPSYFREMPKRALTSTRMVTKKHSAAVRAEYNSGGRGGGGDFVAGFLLGGAVFGTLAYVFAPQIRRSLLNEDEYGFRKAKRPIYYDDDDDDGLEKTRQTLNSKLGQLNAAIDKVSSRLRGGNNAAAQVPIETDPEVEATM